MMLHSTMTDYITNFKRGADVGILRMILALSVINAHTVSSLRIPFLLGGAEAVQVFFIISGFYMTLVLSEVSKYRDYKTFISNRLARIFSTYYLIIPIVAIISWQTLKFEYTHSELRLFTAILVTVCNLMIIPSDFLMFFKQVEHPISVGFTSNFAADHHPLYAYLISPPSWSLPLEMYFYFIIPLLLRHRKMLNVVFFLSVLVRFVLLYHFGGNDPWTYRFFPSEICFFIAGVYSYLMYVRILKNFKGAKSFLLTAAVCLFLIALKFQNFYPLGGGLIDDILRSFIFYGLFGILICTIFKLTRKSKIDQLIGSLSFPVYLLHWGIICFIRQHNRIPSFFAVTLLTLLFSIALMPALTKFEKYLRDRFEKLAK
jgi:peptidoglycan/LPS O-acetylase OafA/YrhL